MKFMIPRVKKIAKNGQNYKMIIVEDVYINTPESFYVYFLVVIMDFNTTNSNYEQNQCDRDSW